jgi:GNAT superfamily N-acetyltransferase
LRQTVKQLREHRRGKSGAISHDEARTHHAALREHHKDVVAHAVKETDIHKARVDAAKGYKAKDKIPVINTEPTPNLTIKNSLSVDESQRKLGDISRGIFGRDVSVEHLASATGAPSGSRVTVEESKDNFIRITFEGTFTSKIDGKPGNYRGNRTFYKENGNIIMHNDGIAMDKSIQGQGFGSHIFGLQVEHASALGVSKIKTHASRSKSTGQVGYSVWPKFGFDGDIKGRPLEFMDELSGGIRDSTRVSQLMKTKEGRDFWKKHGSNTSMEFDLTPGSQSRQVWASYKSSKTGKVSPVAKPVETHIPKPTESVHATATKTETETTHTPAPKADPDAIAHIPGADVANPTYVKQAGMSSRPPSGRK